MTEVPPWRGPEPPRVRIARSKLEQAKLLCMAARRQWERLSKVWEFGAFPEYQIDQAAVDLQVAEEEVKIREAELEELLGS